MNRGRAIGLLALGLCVLTAWTLRHHYADISHDAMLYSLLALRRIHPDALSNDPFVRFGSQDRFTVFSPIFAFMIRQFGLAAAAAILTFLSQTALFCCAWVLARRFMSAATALLATGLLLSLPGYYGSTHMFSYTEDFVTPRLAAEALALGGLAAALSRRMAVALVCLLVALLIHPIIALAGIVMLILTRVATLDPKLFTVTGGALLSAALIACLLLPFGPFQRFDSQWLGLIAERTPYVFAGNWLFDDWSRLGITVSVLTIGALFAGQQPLRTVCTCAIATALGGIAMTFLWCDLLHTILPTQIQMWRCVWIASVLAVVLSPVIAVGEWQSRNALRRAALLFIGSSLLLRADSGAVFATVFSIASAVAARKYPQFRYGQYVLLSASALLLVSVGLAVGDGLPAAVPIAGCLVVAWWIQQAVEASAWKAYAFAALAGVAFASTAPDAVRSWTSLYYTSDRYAAFAPWRDRIVPRAQVLWPESPVNVWYLLNRPSYYSIPQLAGFVFSRAAAFELDRRTGIVRQSLLASAEMTRPTKDLDSVTRLRRWTPGTLESLDAAGLSIACADRDLGYVVAPRPIGPIVPPPITPNPMKPKRLLYLYDCKDSRGS